MDKIVIRNLLGQFTRQFFERYYITHPPQITKFDNIGYGLNKSGTGKSKQSINFNFKTTQPDELEIETFIRIFVESLEELRWKVM